MRDGEISEGSLTSRPVVHAPEKSKKPAEARIQLFEQQPKVFWGNHSVVLTSSEHLIVHLLILHAGYNCSYRQLYDLMHVLPEDRYDHLVTSAQAAVKRIREKLCAVDPEFDEIQNIPGFGYRWGDSAVQETEDSAEESREVTIGKFVLYPEMCQAFLKGTPLPLTVSEFKVLDRLAAEPGKVVSHKTLHEELYGERFATGRGSKRYKTNIRTFVKRIRKKCRAVDDTFDDLKSLTNLGYRLGDPSPEEPCTALPKGDSSSQEARKCVVGNLELHLDAHRAFLCSSPLPLTLREFRVLAKLVTGIGDYIPYEELYGEMHEKGPVSGEDPDRLLERVRTVLQCLKKKCRIIDPAFDEIETISGLGYRLRKPGS